MEWGTIAGVVTAFFTMCTALAGWQVSRHARAAKRELAAVHTIINQDKTDRDNWNRALIRALRDAGVQVPIDQSLPAVPVEEPRE